MIINGKFLSKTLSKKVAVNSYERKVVRDFGQFGKYIGGNNEGKIFQLNESLIYLLNDFCTHSNSRSTYVEEGGKIIKHCRLFAHIRTHDGRR